MYTLFSRPGWGSVVVEAVLEETEQPFRIETVALDSSGKLDPDFRKINPLGELPTLLLPNGSIMTESAAICIYLADLHQQAQLSPNIDSTKRPPFLRWMAYMSANIYMTYVCMKYPSRYTTSLLGSDGVRDAATQKLAVEWAIFSDAVGEGPYILGDLFSVADLYAAMLISWSADPSTFFAKHPNLKRQYQLATQRPRIATVWQRNKLPLVEQMAE
jgi:glutathione S-transferase